MNELIAKKKFGQNFLVDLKAQQKVVKLMKDLVELYPKKPILEIGPGQGDLTQHFLNFGRHIVALEIDSDSVALLKQKFLLAKNLELVHTDASRLINSEDMLSGNLAGGFILLSSLPYNVGSRILVDLAVNYPDTPIAVILQKEVIDKVVKKDGFTFFGAWINLFWDLKNKADLSPHVFSPKPKVYSGLMIGIPKKNLQDQNYLQSDTKRKVSKDILKKLFANPSKTLANNLKNLGWSGDKVNQFLELNQLDSKTRLGWNNYENILRQAFDLEFTNTRINNSKF